MRRTIGYMPEERGLYAKEDTANQLIFFACLHGSSAVQAYSSAHELLERLGLADRAKGQVEILVSSQPAARSTGSIAHSQPVTIGPR